MKKYMIRCDIEGVSGVVSYDQADPEGAEFEMGRRLFMGDLTALLQGLNDGGADEIIIYDEHFRGRNIDLDALPENATAICGKPPYTAEWAGGLDSSCTGLILLGFHSMRGTGAVLHHSYEPDIKELTLNGYPVGEIGIETAIAGDWGVPLQLISADSAGVREARELVPGVTGVTVKQSLGPSAAACPAGAVTRRALREAAEAVAPPPPATEPWQLKDPQLRVVFNPGPYLEAFRRLFDVDDSVVISGRTVTQCWADYWHMKLQAQEAVR